MRVLTVDSSDNGRYTCNVSNGDISVEYSYILKIEGEFKLSIPPSVMPAEIVEIRENEMEVLYDAD